MKVTKDWLERKVAGLNTWLTENSPAHFQYKQKERNRNYYVNKLIELEENELTTIKI